MSVRQALHAAIPNSKLVIMPGVGHVSSVEAAEQFNVEVRQFLGRLNTIWRSPEIRPPAVRDLILHASFRRRLIDFHTTDDKRYSMSIPW